MISLSKHCNARRQNYRKWTLLGDLIDYVVIGAIAAIPKLCIFASWVVSMFQNLI